MCLIYTDRQWKIFPEAVGKGDLLKTDPRFADIRNARRTSTSSTSWSLKNSSSGPRANGSAPAGKRDSDLPMHTLESLLEDEHLAATGFFTEVEHPIVGRIRETAVPSEWSGTVPLNRHPAAALGEHTVDVLREAGLGEQRIHQLVADNIVFQRPVVLQPPQAA